MLLRLVYSAVFVLLDSCCQVVIENSYVHRMLSRVTKIVIIVGRACQCNCGFRSFIYLRCFNQKVLICIENEKKLK